MMKKRGNKFLVISCLILLAVAFLISSLSFTPKDVFYLNEDDFFSYNFTQNTTFSEDELPLVFAINTVNSISSSNPLHSGFSLDNFYWFYFSSSSQGIFNLNVNNDNETGLISIPIQVTKNNGSSGGIIEYIDFIINATNDAPYFLNLESFYSLDEPGQTYILNASDEEEHYPLIFTLDFFDNCTHYSNSPYNDGENCSLFNLTTLNDNSFSIEYIYSLLDVGNYWANFTMQESSHSCPHEYCLENYTQNWTISKIVHFLVPYALGMDSSDCENAIFIEGLETNCTLEFFTYGEEDLLNISSYGFFTNYPGAIPASRSWFFSSRQVQTSSFIERINVSLTPTKSQVGNWSINFSLFDITRGDFSSKIVPINVDYVESPVVIGSYINLTNENAIYEDRVFNLLIYDEDLKIRDKTLKNEILSLSSNVSWISFNSGTTIVGNNFTNFTVLIDYDSLVLINEGNHSCLINATDSVGNLDQIIFVVEVLDDSPAVWNQSNYSYVLNEGDAFYLNISDFVSDLENDSISFSLYSSAFPSFNINSGGIISFTPNKSDVGNHTFIINAYDGKLNSLGYFNFLIYNFNDSPIIYQINAQNATPTSGINSGDTITFNEGNNVTLYVYVQDDDFLIPESSSNIYLELISLTNNLENTSFVEETFSINFDSGSSIVGNPNKKLFTSNFIAQRGNVGNYTLNITVKDFSNESDSILLNFVINEVNYPPVLDFVSNQSYSVLETIYYDINATDREDSPSLPETGFLTYSLENKTVFGDFLTINSTTGVLNFTLNSSYSGEWIYNVSVNDSSGLVDWQIFSIKVYDFISLTNSSLNSTFSFMENSTSNLKFNFSYPLNNTLFNYSILLDNITYLDGEFFYSNLSEGVRDEGSFNFVNSSSIVLDLNFSFNFYDETYFKFKNLSLVIYPNGFEEVSSTFVWDINVSHKNHNLTFVNNIPDYGGLDTKTTLSIDLSNYFLDIDSQDEYYNQFVNFSLNCSSGSYICPGSSFENWTLKIYSPTAVKENLSVIGYEYLNNKIITTISSNLFSVEFKEPTVVEVIRTTSSTQTKFASFKIVLPYENFVLSDSSLEIPFYLENTGEVDISNILLNSSVYLYDSFSDSIEVVLENPSISKLSKGQRINNSITLSKNFERPGRYKILIVGDSSSPKTSHSVEFYVEIRERVIEEIEQMLIFTEKFILENPQCLELQESVKRVYDLYEQGKYEEAIALSNSTISLCEKFISKNEQIQRVFYVVGDKFYILMVLTLSVFVFSFLFYIYKRKRFNNTYIIDDLNKRGNF